MSDVIQASFSETKPRFFAPKTGDVIGSRSVSPESEFSPMNPVREQCLVSGGQNCTILVSWNIHTQHGQQNVRSPRHTGKSTGI
jgi:hypothetical protein